MLFVQSTIKKMNNNNTFEKTVASLFKGMDSFITTKTVVGDAIHIGDTIILTCSAAIGEINTDLMEIHTIREEDVQSINN